MRRTKMLATAAGVVLGVAALSASAAGLPYGPESRVWLSGASTIRGFTCVTGDLRGGISLPDGERVDDVLLGDALAAATLTIPVETLDCGIGKMNRDLRKTLHADEHPAIEFRLARHDVTPGDGAAVVGLEGTLRIAGVERPVTVDAVARRDGAGALRLRGSRTLRASDFGIRPPRRFGGLLRVDDRVTVGFDVVLEQRLPTP